MSVNLDNERPSVLLLGSGPEVVEAAEWPKEWFDYIIVINNAWRVREDWDALIAPEDFPKDRLPETFRSEQKLVGSENFATVQNAYGGYIFCGGTIVFAAGYWVLAALQPRVLAFFGCNMSYTAKTQTHFYGQQEQDTVLQDVSLRDLKAKSSRLGVIAATQNCACVTLSTNETNLVYPHIKPEDLRSETGVLEVDFQRYSALRSAEEAMGYRRPYGEYDTSGQSLDLEQLGDIDQDWRALWNKEPPRAFTEQSANKTKVLPTESELKRSLDENRVSMTLTGASLIASIQDFRTKVEQSNSLEPEFKELTLKFLNGHLANTITLVEHVPAVKDQVSNKVAQTTMPALSAFVFQARKGFEKLFDPTRLGEMAAPSTVVLLSAAFAAQFGAPLAGVAFGAWFTGKETAEKLARNVMTETKD